jgi:hypothetical protein
VLPEREAKRPIYTVTSRELELLAW